jgi:uncharacterized protein (TIGR03435 family)
MGFGRIAVCRRWGVVGVVVLGMAGYLFAAAGQIQAASSQSSAVSTEQSFEVATIKPSAPDENARSLGWTGRRFTARYTTISQMVQFAYNLQAKQVVGAPGWLDSTTYDIEGQAEAGEPSAAEFRGMMQRLLAERLGMKTHWESRTMSAYELVVAKGGAKLQASKVEDRAKAEIPPGVRIQRGPHLWMRVLGVGGTMPELAAELQRVEFDRPVVDRTGIKGEFDFAVTATSTKPFFVGEAPDTSEAAPPLIFTALEEQLGLRLEAVKTAVPCLVVDAVERPSAN